MSTVRLWTGPDQTSSVRKLSLEYVKGSRGLTPEAHMSKRAVSPIVAQQQR